MQTIKTTAMVLSLSMLLSGVSVVAQQKKGALSDLAKDVATAAQQLPGAAGKLEDLSSEAFEEVEGWWSAYGYAAKCAVLGALTYREGSLLWTIGKREYEKEFGKVKPADSVSAQQALSKRVLTFNDDEAARLEALYCVDADFAKHGQAKDFGVHVTNYHTDRLNERKDKTVPVAVTDALTTLNKFAPATTGLYTTNSK